VSNRRADDAFIQSHERDASTNPAKDAFFISFADARRAFHPGETIKLTFRFYRWQDDGSPLRARRTIPQPQETYTAYLNHIARFDRPGHYRFYATSPAGSRTRPPFASNILEFDILPRDAAWERQTVAAAVRTLDANSSNADAVAALRFLDTEASVAEIARRFGDLPMIDGGSHLWDWRLALSASRHRQRTIQLMQAQIDRADRTISDEYIDLTAGLIADEGRRDGAAGRFRAAFDSLSRRRLAALSKVHVLEAELRRSFENVLGNEFGLLQAPANRGWRFFPETVERMLHTFTPAEQKVILQRGWRQFSDPAFVPMLQRIVDANTAADGPQDVALRELYEADPQRGRAAILRELAKERPATTVYGTGVLPDPELPQLDGVFADALEHATMPVEYRRALERVERYAGGGIAGRVRGYTRNGQNFTTANPGRSRSPIFFESIPSSRELKPVASARRSTTALTAKRACCSPLQNGE